MCRGPIASAIAGLILGSAVPVAAYAQATTVQGRCLFVLDGKTILNGGCPIQLQRGGGFTVGSSQRGGYFATVQPLRDGIADGYWNEERFANHAHTGIGTLRRNDACWTNDRAIVCAWR